MTTRIIALAVAASVTGAVAIAQTPTPTPAPVTIAGCVERTMTPGSKPGSAPQFRLIDTAPATPAPPPGGRGTTAKPPIPIERQYLLTAVASIDLGKFQNQRVEVLGTVAPAPVATPPATAAADAPRFVLAAMQVKMVSNECK